MATKEQVDSKIDEIFQAYFLDFIQKMFNDSPEIKERYEGMSEEEKQGFIKTLYDKILEDMYEKHYGENSDIRLAVEKMLD